MLRVMLNCPICGLPMPAESLAEHMQLAEKLTGAVTLRLNPNSPFTHEPEAQELETAPPTWEEDDQGGGEAETDQATETEAGTETAPEAEETKEPEAEAEAEAGPETEAEAGPETEAEPEPEPEPKPRRTRKPS